MTDEQLRARERDPCDEEHMAQVLRERLRRREVSELVVEFCAFLGHSPAQVALDRATPTGEFVPWLDWATVAPFPLWVVVARFGAALSQCVVTQAASKAKQAIEQEHANQEWGPEQQVLDFLEGGVGLCQELQRHLARAESWAIRKCVAPPPRFTPVDELRAIEFFRYRLGATCVPAFLSLMEQFPDWDYGGDCDLLRQLEDSDLWDDFAEAALPVLLGQDLRRATGRDEGIYLRSRVDQGELPESHLVFAARAGHFAANSASGVEAATWRELIAELAHQPWPLLTIALDEVWRKVRCAASPPARRLVQRDVGRLLRTLEWRETTPPDVLARWDQTPGGTDPDPIPELTAAAIELRACVEAGEPAREHLEVLEAVLARDKERLAAGLERLQVLLGREGGEKLQALEQSVRRSLIRHLLYPQVVRVDYEDLLEDEESHED